MSGNRLLIEINAGVVLPVVLPLGVSVIPWDRPTARAMIRIKLINLIAMSLVGRTTYTNSCIMALSF